MSWKRSLLSGCDQTTGNAHATASEGTEGGQQLVRRLIGLAGLGAAFAAAMAVYEQRILIDLDHAGPRRRP